MRFIVKICLFSLLFLSSLSFAEEEDDGGAETTQDSRAPAQAPVKKSYINTKVFEEEEEEAPRMGQEALQGMNQEFQDAHKDTQFRTQVCKAQNQFRKCPDGAFFDVTSCSCVMYKDEIGGEEWDEKGKRVQSNENSLQSIKSNSNNTDSMQGSTTPQSSSSEPPAPSISNKTMQDYLNECAQASVDAESTCDIDKNEDTSGFSSGMARLSSMLNKSGAANSSGGCAMLGAMGLAGGSILGGAKAECFSAKANCESACARAKSFLGEYSNFTDLVTSYSKRCDKIKDVSQALIGNAAGMGSLVNQANNCRKNLPPTDDCLKNPIKCAFGNSSCKTEADKRNNPSCFCQFVNPNDPMCAIVDQIQESSPNRDVASINTSSKLDTGSHLPLSPSPDPVEQVNPAEALLANSKPQPVGTVELAGKSGDGLGGGGGSALGASQKASPQGRSAGSNISTKVNAGFLSASSFGVPAVVGTGPKPNQPIRFKMYKNAIKEMYPRMSKEDALALAHRLALRDVEAWQSLQASVNQGQTEEQLTPLKAVLADRPLYMDEVKTVTAADFIVKRQVKEEEDDFLTPINELIIEGFFYLHHREKYPFAALVAFFMMFIVPPAFLIAIKMIYEAEITNSRLNLLRKGNKEYFSIYEKVMHPEDYQDLISIDFGSIGKFAGSHAIYYIKHLSKNRDHLNAALRRSGLNNEHSFIQYEPKVLMTCLRLEGNVRPDGKGFQPMFLEKNERRLNYSLAYYGLTDEMQWKYQKPISPEALMQTYGDKKKQTKRAG
jgi:hypothetical protein